MKSFLTEAKATLGLAPKTTDPEYDEKVATIRQTDDAITAYDSACSRMNSALQDVSTALEQMAKALCTMSALRGAPSSLQKISSDYTHLAQETKDKYVLEYKQAIGKKPLNDLKNMVDELKKLDQARTKAVNEYDAHRDVVKKKEDDYAKKGKDLKDSKNYQDDVKKRDEKKALFETADKKAKDKFEEFDRKRFHEVLSAMTVVTESGKNLFEHISNDSKKVNDVAKSTKV